MLFGSKKQPVTEEEKRIEHEQLRERAERERIERERLKNESYLEQIKSLDTDPEKERYANAFESFINKTNAHYVCNGNLKDEMIYISNDGIYIVINECDKRFEKKLSINFDDIICYRKEGDLKLIANVHGGGGGGSNIAGAIIGGIVAGPAGAIIASRQGINEIETTYEEYDTPFTIISYSKKYTNTETELKIRGFELYEKLSLVLPKKEKNYVLQQSQNKIDNESNMIESNNIDNRLKKLKALYEEGLITEDEYNEKRKSMISEL